MVLLFTVDSCVESAETFQYGVGECRSRDRLDRLGRPAGVFKSVEFKTNCSSMLGIWNNTSPTYSAYNLAIIRNLTH